MSRHQSVSHYHGTPRNKSVKIPFVAPNVRATVKKESPTHYGGLAIDSRDSDLIVIEREVNGRRFDR
jgi:hypothetical protein